MLGNNKEDRIEEPTKSMSNLVWVNIKNESFSIIEKWRDRIVDLTNHPITLVFTSDLPVADMQAVIFFLNASQLASYRHARESTYKDVQDCTVPALVIVRELEGIGVKKYFVQDLLNHYQSQWGANAVVIYDPDQALLDASLEQLVKRIQEKRLAENNQLSNVTTVMPLEVPYNSTPAYSLSSQDDLPQDIINALPPVLQTATDSEPAPYVVSPSSPTGNFSKRRM